MCSRITLAAERERILRDLGLRQLDIEYRPRYNIAPTQPVLTAAVREGEIHAAQLRWGLVPVWAKDPAVGNRLINARAETLAEKPAFRDAFKKRRCVVVADGFYEWQTDGKRKLPSYIHFQDRRPFTFAGLWERWDKGADGPIFSCTIVTTEANPLVAHLHDRMPLILSPDDRNLWLDPDSDPQSLQTLLHPYAGEGLEVYRVSPQVNRSAYDSPDCIEPISPDEDPVASDASQPRPTLCLFPEA